MLVFAKTGYFNAIFGGQLICDVGLCASIYGRPRDTISGFLLSCHVGFQFDGVDLYPLLDAVTSLETANLKPAFWHVEWKRFMSPCQIGHVQAARRLDDIT